MEELATGFGLVEGPTWINDTGLLFSDVIKGGVYLLDHLNNVSTIVEYRRGIGGIAIHAVSYTHLTLPTNREV